MLATGGGWLVGKDTRKLLDRVYPDKGPALESGPSSPPVVRARESGMITVIGHEALVEEARRSNCQLDLVPALGEFVPADAPLFRVHGEPADLDEDALHKAIILKLEPTLDEDVAYGIRPLRMNGGSGLGPCRRELIAPRRRRPRQRARGPHPPRTG
jgi:uncharacterized membrane protein